MKRKSLAVILAVVMLLSLIPFSALAVDSTPRGDGEGKTITVQSTGLADGTYDSIISDTVSVTDQRYDNSYTFSTSYLVTLESTEGLSIVTETFLAPAWYYYLSNADTPGPWNENTDLLALENNILENKLKTSEDALRAIGYSSITSGCDAYYFLGISSNDEDYGIVIQVAGSGSLPQPTTYSVTVSGNAATDVSAPFSATPGEDYSFTVTKNPAYSYTISATVSGTAVELAENGNTYTIAAEAVTGDIVITAEKEALVSYDVTVTGNAAEDVTAAAKATGGEAFSFKVTKVEGYTYTIGITVDGNPVAYTLTGNTYSLRADQVSGDIVITVEKTKNVVFGDANGDGYVTSGDAAIAYAIANLVYNGTVTDEMLAALDVDGDGMITAKDAALIYAFANEKITAFPVQNNG